MTAFDVHNPPEPDLIDAAQAMLDSPVLAETLTLRPSRSHSRPASITARMPPSLMVLRLTPRVAPRS